MNRKNNISSQRIKELRIKYGYTMEKLADLIGVSKSTIAKWENGYVENMRQDRVYKLAKLFNVTPTYIMGYEEIPQADYTVNGMMVEMTDKEKQFMNLYSRLDEYQQELVNNMIQAFSKKQ